jgi:hypothetical protein
MNLFSKRFGLVLAGVVGVGAIAALVMGASFALFTSTANGPSHTFTAGTVTLGSTATGTCTTDTTNMEPGDSGTCTFTVAYSGTLDAYIGAEVVSANAISPLGSELQFSLNSNPANGTTPVLIGSGPDGTYTATLGYSLPLGAGNTYQGLSTTLRVVFYAVQCSNNGLNADGTLDSGTNETCADPNPASWSEAGNDFAIDSGSGFQPSTVAAGGDTSLTVTVDNNGYYNPATTTITWPAGDLTFTGNGDSSASCSPGTNSETCTYTDFSHSNKSDSFNFTVGSGVSGSVTVTIMVAGSGGPASAPTATATATETLTVS